MILYTLMIYLLLSNAVTIRRDKSILFSRVGIFIILLLYLAPWASKNVYMLVIYTVLIFLINATTLQLTKLYNIRVWNIVYYSSLKIININLERIKSNPLTYFSSSFTLLSYKFFYYTRYIVGYTKISTLNMYNYIYDYIRNITRYLLLFTLLNLSFTEQSHNINATVNSSGSVNWVHIINIFYYPFKLILDCKSLLKCIITVMFFISTGFSNISNSEILIILNSISIIYAFYIKYIDNEFIKKNPKIHKILDLLSDILCLVNTFNVITVFINGNQNNNASFSQAGGSWNQSGPNGPNGPGGPQGPMGPNHHHSQNSNRSDESDNIDFWGVKNPTLEDRAFMEEWLKYKKNPNIITPKNDSVLQMIAPGERSKMSEWKYRSPVSNREYPYYIGCYHDKPIEIYHPTFPNAKHIIDPFPFPKERTELYYKVENSFIMATFNNEGVAGSTQRPLYLRRRDGGYKKTNFKKGVSIRIVSE